MKILPKILYVFVFQSVILLIFEGLVLQNSKLSRTEIFFAGYFSCIFILIVSLFLILLRHEG